MVLIVTSMAHYFADDVRRRLEVEQVRASIKPVCSREVTASGVAARVILIDGQALSGLMVQHHIGVQDQHTYVIKRIDEDFFDES
jgi:restriction endonuclease Mrr